MTRTIIADGSMFGPMPDEHHPTSDASAQALLAAIVDSTADAIISFDIHGRIRSWNRAAEALFGYTAQEAIGRDADLLVKPLGFIPHGETQRGAFDRALAGGRFQRDTLRVAKDGSVIEVALTATQIKDADGRVIGVSAIMRNIGVRKRVEAELRHSQERLTLALKAANAGVWDWLPIANKVRWSPECFELMGCDPALGVPPFDVWLQRFVVAEDRERVAEVFRAAARGDLGPHAVNGQRVEIEYRIDHPTRGVRWLSAPTRIEVENGRVVRVIGLNIDITDRKTAEGELRASEARLAGLVHSAMDAVIAVDTKLRISSFNPAAERLFEIAADEMLGQPIDLLIPPRLRDQHLDQLRAFLESGDKSRRLGEHGEIKAIRQNGEEFSVEVSISRTDAGSSWLFCAVFRDITEREQAEAALRQSEERLRTFIEHVPAAIAMFDRDMRYLAVSRRWGTYFCPDETNLIGRCHYEVFPEISDNWKEMHRRGFAGEVVSAEDDPFPRADGRVQHVRWEIRPWRYGSGEVGGITIFTEDVSRRVDAERDLRRQRADLDYAQFVARTGSWRLDIIHNELTWSTENYRIFGVKSGVPQSYETFLASVHPDDRAYVDEKWQAALRGEPYDIEHRIIVDGEVKWLRERAFLEFDDTGRLLGGFGVSQDITDFKKAEQALAWNSRRNALLSDIAARLLESTDPRKDVERVCREVMTFLHCEVFFHFSAEEATGQLRLNACVGVSPDEACGLECVDQIGAGRGSLDADRRCMCTTENTRCGSRAEVLKACGVQAYLCHPLAAQGRLLGTLSFGARSRARFSDEEINVTRAVADLVAMSMHRLEVESALRESEEQLRLLGDNLPNSAVYCFSHDADGTRRFHYVSSGIERLCGVSAEAVLRDANVLLEQVLPEGMPRLIEAEAQSRSNLVDFSADVPMRRPDGEVRWMRLQSRPRKLPDGRVMWYGVQTDVTERMQAVAELERIRYLLTEGQRIAHLGSFEYIAATGQTVWSDEQKRIYGLDTSQPSPAYEDLLRHHIHPDDAGELDRAFKAAIADAAVFENENRIVRPDGTVRWIHNRAQPYLDSDGRLVKYMGATLDITDRKVVEAAMRERKEQLRLSTEAGGVGPFTVELDAGIVHFGSNTAAMVGFPQLQSTTIAEVTARVHRDDVASNRRLFEEALDPEGTGDLRLELRFVRPGGDVRWLMCSGRVEFEDTKDGKVPQRLFGVCVDATERKMMLEALARANTDLENKVAERTSALALEMARREETQQRLAQAQRLEATGRLTSGLAHDFNNTLSAVSAHLEVAELRVTDEIACESIRHALDAVELGASLNRRLLSIARKTAYPPRVSSVAKPLTSVVSLIRRTLGRDITVVLDIDGTLWPVMVDRGEFESAILNLAINSRDAMSGGGEIEIRARNVTFDQRSLLPGDTKPGDYVCVSVRDTGGGMTPEVLAKAGEPFFTTKSAMNGTGLGLSSVREFLKRGFGAMTIDSAPGTGTTVSLYFPRAPADSRGPSAMVSRPSEVPLGDGELVLVVDDDERVLEATHKLLEGLGYAVVTAHSGSEALASLATVADIRALVSDVVMPGLSGFDVARRVQSDFPTLGVILVSGDYYDRTPVCAPRPADFPIIAKPFSRAEIAQALRAVLTKS